MNSAGLNQVSLAGKAGVSPPSINRYLRGRIPRGKQLAALAGALGVSSDWLLGIPETKSEGLRSGLPYIRDLADRIIKEIDLKSISKGKSEIEILRRVEKVLEGAEEADLLDKESVADFVVEHLREEFAGVIEGGPPYGRGAVEEDEGRLSDEAAAFVVWWAALPEESRKAMRRQLDEFTEAEKKKGGG